MGEVFEGRDLSETVFWGVNLRSAMFRDADLSESTFFHTLWSNVLIDGVVDRLVVNGVDVTDYVNDHDRWYPLRTQLEPSTAVDLRAVWSKLQQEWSALLRRATGLSPETARRSVNGEWSLLETLRHLIFAMNKWFTWPILGERLFSPIGLPNAESRDGEWPGLDREADPSFDEVLAVRSQLDVTFSDFIAGIEFDALPQNSEVLENGSVLSTMCFHVVLEEEFEHLRYATRDLDRMSGWENIV